MQIWQPGSWPDVTDQGIMPNTWFRRYESDHITQIKGPVYIEGGDIWAKPVPDELQPLLAMRLVQVDLECTPSQIPGPPVPPEQSCIHLWLGGIDPSWRNRPGEGCSSSSTGSSIQQPVSSISAQQPTTTSTGSSSSTASIQQPPIITSSTAAGSSIQQPPTSSTGSTGAIAIPNSSVGTFAPTTAASTAFIKSYLFSVLLPLSVMSIMT